MKHSDVKWMRKYMIAAQICVGNVQDVFSHSVDVENQRLFE